MTTTTTPDVIDVTFTYDANLGPAAERGERITRTVELPSWCEAAPLTCAGIYLFGYADAASDYHMALVSVDVHDDSIYCTYCSKGQHSWEPSVSSDAAATPVKICTCCGEEVAR